MPPKIPIVPKSSTKSSGKLSSVPTWGYGRQTLNRTGMTSSSEKGNSVGNVSKSSFPKPTAAAQSGRSSFKPNTSTSISSNNPRRNSLSDQRDSVSQIKSRIDSGLTKDRRAKALGIPSIETKTTVIVDQSKSLAHQIQPKNVNIQSQKQNTVTTGGQKIFQHNESRLTNIKTPKYLQKKTSLSPFGQLSPNSLPINKLSRRIQPQTSSSEKNEIQGRFKKDSADQLPQGTKNKQTPNKEDLMITPNRSSESFSLASTSPIADNSTDKLVEGSSHAECYEGALESSITHAECYEETFESSIPHTECHEETFESAISYAATEFSTEEQRMSHMECKPKGSVTSPTNEEAISNLDDINKFLCLKEIGNEKFSCDEVKNSSMISENDNEDPLSNPGVSEMPTIIFDNKAFLQERRNKEFFEFYRNEQSVMKSIFRVKNTNLEILLNAELCINEAMFLAKQEPPEIYSQIHQSAILLCSEIERETKKLIPMVKGKVEELKSLLTKSKVEEPQGLLNKSKVEEPQSFKNRDRESLQAKGLGEISRESNDPDDSYTERKGKAQEFEKDKNEEREINSEFLKLTLQPKEIPNKFVSLERQAEESEKLQVLEVEELKKPLKCEVEIKVPKKFDAEEEVLKKTQPHLKASPLNSQKEFVGMSYLPKDDDVELSSFLDNIKEASGKSISHSKVEVTETYFQDEKRAIELSLQDVTYSDGTETFRDEKRAIELSLQDDTYTEEGTETFQDEKRAIELSLQDVIYTEGGTETFPDEKRAIELSLQDVSYTEGGTETFPDEKRAIELSLQNDTYTDEGTETSFQNEKNAIELSLQNYKMVVERLASLQNKKKFVEVAVLPYGKIVSQILPLQNESDLQLPLHNKREKVDMSYLPKNKTVELSFLNELKEAVGISLQDEREAVERSLQDKREAVERSLQDELEAYERSLQDEREAVERILQDEKNVEDTLQKWETLEGNVQNTDKVIESFIHKDVEVIKMSTWYDKEALDITSVDIETVSKNLRNKQQQSELENLGNIQKERGVEVEKASHQQSVRKKTFRTWETIDTCNYPNKKEIVGESMNKTTRNELKLTNKEEEISEQITAKRKKPYITDRETVDQALKALSAETID